LGTWRIVDELHERSRVEPSPNAEIGAATGEDPIRFDDLMKIREIAILGNIINFVDRSGAPELLRAGDGFLVFVEKLQARVNSQDHVPNKS